MKTVIYITFLLFLANVGFSQAVVTDSVHPLFKGKLDGAKIREQYENFEIPMPIRFKQTGPYNHIILSLFHSKVLYVGTALNLKENLKELDSFKYTNPDNGGFESRGGFYNKTAVPLYDSLPILVTAYGINPQNKFLYEFRVLQNRKEVILPWQEIKFFSPVMTHYRYNVNGSKQKEMAYLGQFSTTIGNSLTIEVRNKKKPDTAFAISAVWIKRMPDVIGVFNLNTIKEFLEVYKYQWKHDFYKPNQLTYYGDIKLNAVDSVLKKPRIFKSQDNTLFFYLKDKVKADSLIEYNLIKNTDSTGWVPNKFDAGIIRVEKLRPGKYKLLLRYSFQRESVNEYKFTIMPAWYQTVWFKIVTGILSTLAFTSFYLLLVNRRQKAKLKKEETQKQLVQAEIKFIKSQFNPHFVFNSLNSIQGLITKNEIDAAYKYLTDFSMLLRNSLKESEKEFISLSKEIQLIDNYLKLEQLRFGFQYKIDVSTAINKDAIEVPVLLLQPVIENAVKHGISGLYERGQLEISYTVTGNDLEIIVKDNGNGYDPAIVKNGYGLKLTKDRIDLINQTLNKQQILWNIASVESGVTATIIFKNWLL